MDKRHILNQLLKDYEARKSKGEAKKQLKRDRQELDYYASLSLYL